MTAILRDRRYLAYGWLFSRELGEELSDNLAIYILNYSDEIPANNIGKDQGWW